MHQDLVATFKAAVECSVYLCPTAPGLTYPELRELGRRLDFLDGEINDSIHSAGVAYDRSQRVVPPENEAQFWLFYLPEEPELRNLAAFDYVLSELMLNLRAEGEARAQLERSVLVERAVARGLPRNDVEATITVLVMAKRLTEAKGALRFAHRIVSAPPPLPSVQYRQHTGQKFSKPLRAKVLPIVKELLARREDGRPSSAEPLDAFADALAQLGLGAFRVWWLQIVAELRSLQPSATPVAVTVLAAALVEGALTFVVRHARSRNLEVFRSRDFDGDPRSWRIDDLVKSAASGSSQAVLDQRTRALAEALCRTRQRIHAGRMLSEHPAGPPDLRREEARGAVATAEMVVRAVLDWLARHPASDSQNESATGG